MLQENRYEAQLPLLRVIASSEHRKINMLLCRMGIVKGLRMY